MAKPEGAERTRPRSRTVRELAARIMPQIASPEGSPEGELFEDYPRELPRPPRDKCEL